LANNDCPVAGKPAVFYGELRWARHKNDMKKKAVIVSGYFNPIHKGHLEYFNHTKAMSDKLFVIVNNDHQRALKGSKEFQGEEERMIIISNMKAVDDAILSVDEDRTVCATLEKIANEYGHDYELAFANGGDQNNDTIPEGSICEKMGIALIDGLGDKIQSSSWLLKKL
jgi:cytidyltransferase-like protein